MKQPAHVSTAVIDLPVGRVRISANQQALTGIDYVTARVKLKTASTWITREAVRQLHHYVNDAAFGFDLPLQFEGSRFQNRVWQALRAIKPGKPLTYGGLAEKLDSGARAVGNACRQNPLPIIIPCHRVVAANGLGGYAGHIQGKVLDRKRWLLAHEGFGCQPP